MFLAGNFFGQLISYRLRSSHPLFTRSHSAHSSPSARHTLKSTFTMGKSDANQTKKRSHKAKATDGEIKHKNKPSFDAMTLKAIDNDGGLRHSQWCDLFRQLCEYKVEFGDCLVPRRYSTSPKLGRWVNTQRKRYKDNTEEKSTSMTAEHIRALNGIGFDWGTSAFSWSVRFQQLCEFTSCHNGTLPTTSSDGGFRLSAATTGCIRKESPVP